MHALDRYIAFLTLVVRLERVRRLVCLLVEQRAMKFTFLPAVAEEIKKLGSEMEDDARKIVTEEIPAIRAHKQKTFSGVSGHLGDARGALASLDSMLTDLDKATNGGPTLGGSSPPPVPSVNARPADTAALPDRKGG